MTLASPRDLFKIHPGILRGFFDALDATATKAAGVWNVPTQSLISAFMSAASTASLVARPEMQYLPKQMVDAWAGERDKFLAG